MAELILRDIDKVYDNGFHAVKDLSIDVQDGEFLVLVGPSGCGKTTALRMIAGLEEITDGELLIGDRVVNDLPSRDRNIAMVFQSYALYPHMTVRENIGFGLALRKMPKAEINEKVERAAQLLDLTTMLDRKPKQLSGGQRQRVAMGRAIVRDAEIFLMDEPLSNLDAKLRVQTRTQIAALQKRLGTTTLYVTHDQVEAMTMGDRVAVLKLGVLQQVGTPAELYNEPSNAFVAAFIGSPSMNLINAGITSDGVAMKDHTLPAERDALARAAGSRVLVGFRPEDLHLADDGIEMTVTLVENLGADTFIYGTAVNDRGEAVDLVARGKATPALGTIVKVSPSRTYIFDAEGDQKRLS
ncbi:MAG: ABC transporter ATP-binding protein [Candidatus Nanopelagicales bacterium]